MPLTIRRVGQDERHKEKHFITTKIKTDDAPCALTGQEIACVAGGTRKVTTQPVSPPVSQLPVQGGVSNPNTVFV